MEKNVFIANVTENDDFAIELHSFLEEHGIKCFQYKIDLLPGQIIKQETKNQIEESDHVILGFSKELNDRKKSDMRREIIIAITEAYNRKSNSNFLIPIKINDCIIENYRIDPIISMSDIWYADFHADSAKARQDLLKTILGTKQKESVEIIEHSIQTELVTRRKDNQPSQTIDDVLIGEQSNMHLFVIPGNWGDAQLEDIGTLLIDTASHINQHLRKPFDETIHVMPGDYPIALIRDSTHDPYTIKLSVRDRLWNQYAYQFAHEFCHVLSNYKELQNHPNNWFHEAICEVASIFTLRNMAKRWRSEPPYPNWRSYADHLDAYWHKTQSRLGTQLPDGVSLNSWLFDNEDMLRTADYRENQQRLNQALVAYELLPIFEVYKTGWNAVRKYPTSISTLEEYLKNWYSLVDLDDRPFVTRISEAFGYPIPSSPHVRQ